MLKKCHFIGIGGIGMSGLARILLNKNALISGSDISSSAVTEALAAAGANIHIGHQAEHIESDMTVVYSTDIKTNNPEYLAAQSLKCPMLHRSELLQLLMDSSCALTVAGTHGKTTTSALLTWVLENSGQNPSYAIGGVVPQLSSNAAYGTGPHFVAEACESDGTFLNYRPFGAIITNIDCDHMDHYGTEPVLIKAFQAFMLKVKSVNHLFWCGEDERLSLLNIEGTSYGFHNNCQLKATNVHSKGWSMVFDVEFNGKYYSKIEVSLVGKHNVLNALAVFGLALNLGIEESLIRESLKTFKGVLRRCEKKGESYGILFLDDYAHHPTELLATIKGIRRAIGDRRLVLIYQPHRYSRAKECLGLYKNVFNDADALFVTEIYAAREEPIPGISHENVIEEIQQNLKQRCQFVARHDVASVLGDFIRPHDVVVTLGAGDITRASIEIMAQLKLKAPAKLKVGVVYGGMSVEHEISLLSKDHVIHSLQSDYYEIVKFKVSRQGVWNIEDENNLNFPENPTTHNNQKIAPEVMKSIEDCDILFPVLHGTFGEDGTIQGFFEMLSKAYVGCDYRSSAICMDKLVTKKLVQAANLSTSPFVGFTVYEWNQKKDILKQQIDKTLRFPLFVKPVRLGSSIGVYKVDTLINLDAAVESAFRFDTTVIVENGIDGREIEFAVLGNNEITVFPPGEILTQGSVYDYEGKYGLNGMQAVPRADLSQEKIAEGLEFAKKAFLAVGGNGMARVDTFLDKNGKFWLNEINPIPGFTKISLYPQMCAINGLNQTDLIDQLIILGLQRKRALDYLELEP